MDQGGLSSALERAERAIDRIDRALSSRQSDDSRRHEALRARVREAVSELDQLIREAQGA